MAINADPHFEPDKPVLIDRIKPGEKELFHELTRPYEGGVCLAHIPFCATKPMPKK